MIRKVDLHLHTYASDGEWSGKQMVENIDKHDVKIFAVTDHDEVSAVSEVAAITDLRTDLQFIRAVESTCTYNDKEHHILLYHIDDANPRLNELLAFNRGVRDQYDMSLIAYLEKRYDGISVEDYTHYDYNPYEGGWRTYGYLRDRKIITDLGDYFVKVKDFQYKKIFADPQELLSVANETGCIPVLAHPPAYAERDFYEVEHLDRLREMGLKGIECHNQYLEDQDNARYYVDYCNKYNLCITGGSDCHGGFARRRIGYPAVDETMIRL